MKQRVVVSKTWIKAVVFDVDGVVFRSLNENGKYLWSRTAKEDLGLTKDHFRKIFSSNWDDVVCGNIETIDHLRCVFQDPLFTPLSITPESYIDYWLKNDNFIDWDVIDFVKTITIPCYLGTNQDYYRTQHIVQLVGHFFFGMFFFLQNGTHETKLWVFQFHTKQIKCGAISASFDR